MKTINNNTAKPFDVNEIDWDRLAEIGVLKDEIELSGELERLLEGEKTNPIFLQLILDGSDIELDATLQLIRKNGKTLVDIVGIKLNQ